MQNPREQNLQGSSASSEPELVGQLTPSQALDTTEVASTSDTQIQRPALPRQSADQGSDYGTSSRVPLPRRTRRVTACLECRRRRRRCTGQVPCRTCRTFGVQCVFDRTLDKRSTEYFRRRVHQEVEELLRLQPSNLRPDTQLAQQQFAPDGTEAALSLQDTSGAPESGLSAREQSLRLSDTRDAAFGENLGQLIAVKSSHAPTASLICTTRCFMASGIKDIPWYPSSLRLQQVELHNKALYQIPAHQVPDVSPLSLTYYMYFNLMAEQKEQSSDAATFVLGNVDPRVDLLFRPRGPLDPLNVSTWACEIIKQFMPFDIFTQLGYVFLVSRLMRWNLCPTLQNYMLLPSIMRPTCAQRCVPHYPSADMQPLPVIREALVRGEHQLYRPVGNVNRAGTQSIKMHWPFGMEEAVVYDAVTGELVLSRLFEAAAADEASWSCGVDFARELSAADKGLFTTVSHNHGWEGLEAEGPYTFCAHQYEKTPMSEMHSSLVASQ